MRKGLNRLNTEFDWMAACVCDILLHVHKNDPSNNEQPHLGLEGLETTLRKVILSNGKVLI